MGQEVMVNTVESRTIAVKGQIAVILITMNNKKPFKKIRINRDWKLLEDSSRLRSISMTKMMRNTYGQGSFP